MAVRVPSALAAGRAPAPLHAQPRGCHPPTADTQGSCPRRLSLSDSPSPLVRSHRLQAGSCGDARLAAGLEARKGPGSSQGRGLLPRRLRAPVRLRLETQHPGGVHPAVPAPPLGSQVFLSRAVAAAPHQKLGHLMVTLELTSLWEPQGTAFLLKSLACARCPRVFMALPSSNSVITPSSIVCLPSAPSSPQCFKCRNHRSSDGDETGPRQHW